MNIKLNEQSQLKKRDKKKQKKKRFFGKNDPINISICAYGLGCMDT